MTSGSTAQQGTGTRARFVQHLHRVVFETHASAGWATGAVRGDRDGRSRVRFTFGPRRRVSNRIPAGEAVSDSPARRVLIAEDEALIRLDLKEMLEEEGYVVVGE